MPIMCNQTRFVMLTKCLKVFHKTATKYNLFTFLFYTHQVFTCQITYSILH